MEGLLVYKGLRVDASRGHADWGSSLSFKKKDIFFERGDTGYKFAHPIKGEQFLPMKGLLQVLWKHFVVIVMT